MSCMFLSNITVLSLKIREQSDTVLHFLKYFNCENLKFPVRAMVGCLACFWLHVNVTAHAVPPIMYHVFVHLTVSTGKKQRAKGACGVASEHLAGLKCC